MNRAPLINPPKGTANIKALLSHDDWFADLDPEDVKALGDMAKDDPRGVRRKLSDGRGLVIVYPISKDSIPMRCGERNAEPPGYAGRRSSARHWLDLSRRGT